MKITDVEAVQDLAGCLGEFGSFFICICIIAEKYTEKEMDLLKIANWARQSRKGQAQVIQYDKIRPRSNHNTFYVNDIPALLYGLTNLEWKIERVNEKPKNKKWVIERWTWQGNTYFRLPDYDPQTNSMVKKMGHISLYYVLTPQL